VDWVCCDEESARIICWLPLHLQQDGGNVSKDPKSRTQKLRWMPELNFHRSWTSPGRNSKPLTIEWHRRFWRQATDQT
jgi:hypothetical protein